MKWLTIGGGIGLGIAAFRNLPPEAQRNTGVSFAIIAVLLLCAFVGGRRSVHAEAHAEANATATAAAAGGSAQSTVQVIVMPAGVDPVAAAAAVGGRAVEVAGPAGLVAEQFGELDVGRTSPVVVDAERVGEHA